MRSTTFRRVITTAAILMVSPTIRGEAPGHTPIDVQLALIRKMILHPNSWKRELYFLAYPNPDYRDFPDQTCVDPPEELINLLKQEFRNIRPYSASNQDPFHPVVFEIATKKEGVRLTIIDSKEISKKYYKILASTFVGSRAGFGSYYHIKLLNQKWHVTKVEVAFES